ncbi:hypothetical protein HK102_001607, partial [Quaeritorhiza haematococci]
LGGVSGGSTTDANKRTSIFQTIASATKDTITTISTQISTATGTATAKTTTAPSQPAPHPTGPPLSREEELRRREEELAARERALREQEDAMRKHGFHPPNWPFFYPYIYHDIEVEIPEPARPVMWKIYRFWMATVGLLFWNTIACFTMLVSHPSGLTTVASDFGFSFVYLFFISATSFYLWYRPVYKAYMNENSLYFYIFMIFEGLHTAFAFYMSVGIPGSGSAGFINLLAVITDGKIVAGVFCCVAFGGWIMDGFFSLWMWKEVHAHYRAQGYSFESAKNEAVGVVGRSGLARSAGESYIRSQTGNFTRA